MKGTQEYGIGQGMMQGLEMFRRHKREDAAESRADERMNMARESHDLSMDVGNFNFDNARDDRPLERRQLERQDEQGERDAWIQEMNQMAREALARAGSGDINAINEFSLSIAEDPEVAPLVMPPEDPKLAEQGMVMFGPRNNMQPTPLKEVFQHVARAGSPEHVRQMYLESQEQYSGLQRDDRIGSYQVGPDGQIHQLDELEGAGGLGVGGGFGGWNKDTLSYYRQKADSFWGSRNPDGQFIIPESARKDREVAEQRMQELEAAGLPPQAAARYGNLSMIPMMDEKSAREHAIKEANALGLEDSIWDDDDEFDRYVADAVPELVQESRRAHEIYNGLTGGGMDSYLDTAIPPDPLTDGGGNDARGSLNPGGQTSAPAAGPAGGTPQTPDQAAQMGWQLFTDAQGNSAYVSPDGSQYIEVQ